MTDQERKAMEMALEALELERTDSNGKKVDLVIPAIEALRQALAQPEEISDYHEGWEEGFKAGLAKAQPESIKPSDLLIDTYSVNLGAWSVNNRGVKITHVPTGTVVCSDSERSQHANKRVAMQKLEAALAQPEPQVCCGDYEKCMKACTPRGRWLVERELAQPEQEPTLTEKDGSPCPEFWDWLPKAYNFEGLGEFTKYNMEVAFLAGKNTALAHPEQAPFGYVYEINGTYTDFSKELPLDDGYDKGTLVPVFTAPPSKPWIGLTEEESSDIYNAHHNTYSECITSAHDLVLDVEAKLKEKNT